MLRNVTAVCFSRGFPQNTYTYLFVPLAVTLTVLKGMPHLHFSANGRYLSISYRKPFRNHVWSFSAKILFTKKKGLTTHAVGTFSRELELLLPAPSNVQFVCHHYVGFWGIFWNKMCRILSIIFSCGVTVFKYYVVLKTTCLKQNIYTHWYHY